MRKKVLITGTNDIATACAQRLFRSGFAVTMLSQNIPIDLYYFRNYSTVIATGSKIIANIKAQSYADFLYNQDSKNSLTLDEFVEFSFSNRQIAVLNEDDIRKISVTFDYCLICDDLLFDRLDIYTSEMTFISCVSKEYNFSSYGIILNGPNMGQVNYSFLEYKIADLANEKNIILADEEGVFVAEKFPGDKVSKNEKIAMLADSIVRADCDGFVKGIMRSGLIVAKGQALACISDKPAEDIKELPVAAVTVSGGVLEAILYDINLNE